MITKNKIRKKFISIYIDEIKLLHLKSLARDLDLPLNSFIKLRLFSNLPKFREGVESREEQTPSPAHLKQNE